EAASQPTSGRVPHGQAAELEQAPEGARARGAGVRGLWQDHHAYPVSGAEEGSLRVRQGPPGERTRDLHRVRPERGAARRGPREGALLAGFL
ncbi:MAG: hypothetical protein AVDCRST_MAG25-2196, partial [uncultured Rubrobacteraceae bacterium]